MRNQHAQNCAPSENDQAASSPGYRERATRYRPADHTALMGAVYELTAAGLTPYDIGNALHLSTNAVLAVLRGAQ